MSKLSLHCHDILLKDKRTISEHVKNIFNTGELREDSVVRNFRITAANGKNYQVIHYNLDVIISVGYRVASHRGMQFRIWATQRLKEYLVKGFVLDFEDIALSTVRNGFLSYQRAIVGLSCISL